MSWVVRGYDKKSDELIREEILTLGKQSFFSDKDHIEGSKPLSRAMAEILIGPVDSAVTDDAAWFLDWDAE